MPAPKPAGPAALATYAAWSIVHFFTQSSFQRSFPRRLTPSRNRPGWTCHHPLPGARGLAQTFSDQHCSAHRQDKVGAASPTHTPLHTGDQQHSSRAPRASCRRAGRCYAGRAGRGCSSGAAAALGELFRQPLPGGRSWGALGSRLPPPALCRAQCFECSAPSVRAPCMHWCSL